MSVARVKCVSLLLILFLFPPSQSPIRPSVRPRSGSPSDAQQPEEEEDGHEQEQGVLPVVIAVVEVTVALVIACILVCSVEGVVGVEDCGVEAEGESTDAK